MGYTPSVAVCGWLLETNLNIEDGGGRSLGAFFAQGSQAQRQFSNGRYTLI